MKKIFATRKIPQSGLLKLESTGFEISVWEKDRPMTHRELVKEFSKHSYDAVLSLLTDEIDKEVVDAMCASGVQAISQFAVGFNNIDIDYAHEKGIVVMNTPAS